jgi:mannose-6-phosphate isomerase
MLYPLLFEPRFHQRIWGGRKLEELYGKPLPPGLPIGESWEISDRPGDVSVIINGPLAGKDLHWLSTQHQRELLGRTGLLSGRFPLLIKILDAREKLSLQVHPPAHKASQLGGEPKTEMWYIAAADPGADLYVGLKRGITRADFEARVGAGTVAECFHRVPVRAGDAMFLPSGRVHAIGAGLVIFEIQQNSDTTYRVFDWNRTGLDGKPRALHVRESLESIDFEDFEPALVNSPIKSEGAAQVRPLVRDQLFAVDFCALSAGQNWNWPAGELSIVAVLSGHLNVYGGALEASLRPGSFCLIPASVAAELRARSDCEFLRARAGK